MIGSFIVQACGLKSLAIWKLHRIGDNDISFMEPVFLNTDIELNWIARDVVDHWKLRWEEDDLSESCIDSNGNTIECCGMVSALWLPERDKKSVPTTLYIAKHAPFHILFGWRFLGDQKLMTVQSHPVI